MNLIEYMLQPIRQYIERETEKAMEEGLWRLRMILRGWIV
jgi:hypothetical protein